MPLPSVGRQLGCSHEGDVLLGVDTGYSSKVDGISLREAEVDQLDATLLSDLTDDVGLADAEVPWSITGWLATIQIVEGGGDFGKDAFHFLRADELGKSGFQTVVVRVRVLLGVKMWIFRPALCCSGVRRYTVQCCPRR